VWSDLYKWATKLTPVVPSELVMDCFELAREIRELDMRASPYDLGELGYEPVPIETPEGKAAYAAEQRAFAARGQALRRLLLDAIDRLDAHDRLDTHDRNGPGTVSSEAASETSLHVYQPTHPRHA
jgi:hypothetical protein